ncbi:site-specific integrase [Pseudomonas petrae]|uniref:Site-specific integrase n=1 Tax=Pseudomonas petrae TaxID=2912190 RepID=A0ABS9I3C9_9PSED|nr:site-specific integrase [Pseudomonas petrae]MCF7533777.1 site-specific integrase [Pseudomonas petrae]MCF7538324.1 site-specific integrase [Pseudomonas petrae]MCF7542244.1 site-specific integrase [Pseudomonas petrae]MCF7555689.1 site-specific integrase [Pseudomonas petrae]
MAYLIRRGAFYYLNLRLPKHLFPRCHTLRLSLNIQRRQPATFLAASLAQKIHQHLSEHPTVDLEMLHALCTQWRDASSIPTMSVPVSGIAEPSKHRLKTGPTLGELAKKYVTEGKAGGLWREVSTHEVERSLRDLFELMGDMPAVTFDGHQARLLKDRLSRCPQYFALLPQFKGKTLLQVIESGAPYKTITAVTVNNRLRKLSAFMNWCKSNGYISENPLMGLKVMTGSAKDARLSFDQHDLTALLSLVALKTEARKHPWRYWLPLLGRFTGARLEELCQLHVADFITLQGIQCIRIDDGHESQNLKNSSSRRILPMHPALTELGLLDHVEVMRKSGSDRLFPDLEPVRGKLGHAPSKWFGRYKTKQGITDPKKTFHSFRHTMIDDLRDAGVQDSLIKRIAGHEDSAVTFGIYGSRLPLNAMIEAIMQIPATGVGSETVRAESISADELATTKAGEMISPPKLL